MGFSTSAIALILILFLAACADVDRQPLWEISRTDVKLTIEATGKLEAVNSTAISGPGRISGMLAVSWMEEPYTVVKAGQLVVRLQGSVLEKDLRTNLLAIMKLDLSRDAKERELALELVEFDDEIEEIGGEMAMAERFASENPLLYSRLEMIEQLGDINYLGAQDRYFEGRKQESANRAGSEYGVIESQRSNYETKAQQNREMQSLLEVRSPHDGIFMPGRSMWGRRLGVGSMVFPGMNLGKLPDLSSMKAVLSIPEQDAVSLSVGQEATVTLDAWPERPISGSVVSVSQTPKSIERKNPAKYITVEILLEQSDTSWITPGQRVSASIELHDLKNAIVIPNQVINYHNGQSTVFVKRGDEIARTNISLSARGPWLSEVGSGLETGDWVLLNAPRTGQLPNGSAQ